MLAASAMTTRIHPLRTGSAAVKEALRRGRHRGPARRTAIFTAHGWSEPLPIHCWLIEHADGPILVDTGELATARDLPFVRFAVTREDEVDRQLERLGVAAADLRRIVLTHGHGDHIDGLERLPGARAQIGARELRVLRSRAAALQRRLVPTPLPPGFDPTPLELRPAAFGAFAESLPLTVDGGVVVVPTPGHTPGHISVVVVIDGVHHFLAGDATYDQAQLLRLEVDGIAPRARVARDTMRTILRHAATHPTVYLPTHDADGPRRLASGELIPS
jgi:N-acyl homoserine lactone hydrolase